MRRSLCLLLAASVLASAPAVIPTPVQAQSFLEELFPRAAQRRRARQQKRYERQLAAERAWERARKAEQRQLRKQQRARAAAAKPVKVSAPKYKTYVATSLKRVGFGGLATAFASAAPAPATAIGGNQALIEELLARGYSLDSAANMDFAAVPAEVRLADGTGELASVEVFAKKSIGNAVLAHYKSAPEFLWVTATGEISEAAEDVLAVFADAGAYGLERDDYRVDLPGDRLTTAAIESTDQPGSPVAPAMRDLMQFEFQMSVAALRYSLDARHGRVDPDRISDYHDFPANKAQPKATFAALTAAQDAAKLMLDFHPREKAFDNLKAALAALDAAPRGLEPVRIAAGTFVRPGQSNDQLPLIIEGIRRKADAEMLETHAVVFALPPVDGLYDDAVVALVRDFQKSQRLGADGIIGKNTIRKIVGHTSVNKREKVLLAMERLRWHPDTFGGTHVFINQPAYRATYFNNGKPQLSMRTIVGKTSNQTNFFHDTIKYVEYNPYWGVPKSILVNEMLPKLRSNPGYLDERDYEITTVSGTPISGWNVDWWGVGGDFPYNVRQRPGPKNALGELKIMFPNKHHIYMHDTPSRSLFKRDARALSHGCVRLADPKAMAAAVLGSTRNDVQARISSGRNNTQKLNRKIPVYVAYFTAWPDEAGKVSYFGDIYGRDKALSKAIATTRQSRAKARNI